MRHFSQGLFDVQGAGFEDLRRQSAHDLVMDFPGYSISGLAVGENARRNEYAVLDPATQLLPENKPHI